MRGPVVAGMFYEADTIKLEEQIKKSFQSKLGPGLPSGSKTKNIIGAVVPHAGYVFSGACAAHAYKEIAESETADVYIILGTDHQGLGATSISMEEWKTPLGIVKVDKVFAHKLMQYCKIKENKLAHSKEHSIEVQLPFLQYINKKKEFRILPITVSHDYVYKELASAIKMAAQSLNKKICVIASSDFTHYGYDYGFVPFDGDDEDVKENLYKMDNKAIKAIIDTDTSAFHKHIKNTGSTICGMLPITVLIELAKLYKVKGKLLKYYTSGDISHDYSTAVGYASIIF